MNRRVVVTGTGIISPAGNDTETFWKNLLEGYCGIDIYSDGGSDINVWSELYQGIDVSSECVSDSIEINSSYSLNMDIYASYVCEIRGGYLYLQEMGNVEPVHIFVYDYMDIDVNVFSDMNWEVK